MSRLYEGLFIFPDALDEEGLDQSVDRVKEELEKLGGTLESQTHMGRKNFARALKGEKAGRYVVLVFRLEGLKVAAFKTRLKLGTNVFRHQFVKVEKTVQEA